ncbi:unnamed protein product, partial [Heterosigma akashiwo]
SVAHAFVVDDRWLHTKTRFGMKKAGKFRMKFMLESLQDLKANLQSKGSDLMVCIGKVSSHDCI